MTEQHTPSAQAATGPVAVSNAAVGPLTIRDLAVLGSVAIIFIASLVPMVVTLAGSLNLWNLASLFYLGIGVVLPLSVGGLFLARRLSPEVKVRIGSLSIDQYASVVASFATFFFFTGTVSNFDVAYLVGLVGSLLLLASTVCARWIPSLAADFAGRAEVPAHVVARDAVPAPKRAAAPKPVAPGVPGAPLVPGARDGVAGPGQATAGQGAQGHWATPQANTSHTAGGQIFTPARENAPAAGNQGIQGTTGTEAALAAAAGVAAAGASSAPAASAAQQSATQAATATGPTAVSAATTSPATTNAAVVAPAAAQSAAAASNIAATSAINTTAQSSQGADHPAAVNASAAAAPAAVGLSQQGATGGSMATTLNPQVAEPAKESAAPVRESIAATVDPTPAVVAEPFWFAVDRPQNTIDEKTRQFAFKLMPGAWILALEDRGNSFLVQDSHGKTGLLLDLVGIERASDSQ